MLTFEERILQDIMSVRPLVKANANQVSCQSLQNLIKLFDRNSVLLFSVYPLQQLLFKKIHLKSLICQTEPAIFLANAH